MIKLPQAVFGDRKEDHAEQFVFIGGQCFAAVDDRSTLGIVGKSILAPIIDDMSGSTGLLVSGQACKVIILQSYPSISRTERNPIYSYNRNLIIYHGQRAVRENSGQTLPGLPFFLDGVARAPQGVLKIGGLLDGGGDLGDPVVD